MPPWQVILALIAILVWLCAPLVKRILSGAPKNKPHARPDMLRLMSRQAEQRKGAHRQRQKYMAPIDVPAAMRSADDDDLADTGRLRQELGGMAEDIRSVLASSPSPQRAMSALTTLCELLDKVLLHPGVARYRRLSKGNKALQGRIGDAGAWAFLEKCGFAADTEGNCLVYPDAPPTTLTLAGRALLESIVVRFHNNTGSLILWLP